MASLDDVDTKWNNMKKLTEKIAIIGSGNIGVAIAKGLVGSGRFSPKQITLTRRKIHLLDKSAKEGFIIQSDNQTAVKRAEIIILAVPPQQMNNLLREINPAIIPTQHIITSVVSGVSITEIAKQLKKNVTIIRVMLNIAVAIQESMTCLAANQISRKKLDLVKSIFDAVGKTVIIDEEQMVSATALCGCGVAFFLRAIRAASQGGIEIGFHPDEALPLAAQTAKGAAALLLSSEYHPEMEIDKVTTPKGCTISGLNEMEHKGFSSAMITGIITSTKKATSLYKK